MRATLIGIGSRGDAQPCVALGVGLQAAGHEATVATHERYRDLVVDHGLAFAPVAEGDVSRGSATKRGERWANRGSKHLPGWVGWYQDAQSVAHQRLVDCVDASADADVVVAPAWATILGLQASRIFGVPLVRVHFKPMLWADTGWGRTVVWQWARPFINQGRKAEGLGPMPWHEPFSAMDEGKVPLIAAYSPLVAPLDHGDWVTPTGYWSLQSQKDEALSPELEAFLTDGPPPVLMTLGALAEDLPSMLGLVSDAFARAGQRGIVTHERFDPTIHHLPPHMFGATYAPHEQVFPRLAAVVHHGGAGTTGAAFRAGVPAVVVPYCSDGPEWGKRVAELGVGPEPIHRKKLTAESLGDAIRQAATDEGMRRRARELADGLARERGVDDAVGIIERYVESVQAEAAAAPGADDDPIKTREWPSCPMCGSTGTVAHPYARDGIYGLPGLWSYRRCDNAPCRTMWLDPVPHEDEIDGLYDRPYYTTAPPVTQERAESALGVIGKVRTPYIEDRLGYDLGSTMTPGKRRLVRATVDVMPGGRDVIEDTASFLPAPAGPARFLEVGFGGGAQLERMQELGWEVVGVDPDPSAVTAVAERGFDVRLGHLEEQKFDDGEFDAVYMAHVIEHVHDPIALLAECHRVLRPGGRLVAWTPNADSRDHKRYQSTWFSLQPPFHLVLFTPESLRSAFEKVGFTVEQGRSTARHAFFERVGSLDLSENEATGGLPSFAEQMPGGRLLRGMGAQYAEAARIALGRQVGEELIFVGVKR